MQDTPWNTMESAPMDGNYVTAFVRDARKENGEITAQIVIASWREDLSGWCLVGGDGDKIINPLRWHPTPKTPEKWWEIQ